MHCSHIKPISYLFVTGGFHLTWNVVWLYALSGFMHVSLRVKQRCDLHELSALWLWNQDGGRHEHI